MGKEDPCGVSQGIYEYKFTKYWDMECYMNVKIAKSFVESKLLFEFRNWNSKWIWASFSNYVGIIRINGV